jgi:hypothetical protein
MANTNAPFGLKQLGLNGSSVAPTMGQVTLRNGILYTDTTKNFFGDLLKMQSTGYLTQWTAGTAVSQLWGVALGCRYYSSSQNNILYSPYWVGADAASGTVDAFIIPGILSPPGLYVIQTDSTGITLADIGANADVVVGSGSTVGGCFSGSYLDHTTLATTATLPLRVVDLWAARAPSGSPGTAAGAYNWAVVALNVQGSTGI